MTVPALRAGVAQLESTSSEAEPGGEFDLMSPRGAKGWRPEDKCHVSHLVGKQEIEAGDCF